MIKGENIVKRRSVSILLLVLLCLSQLSCLQARADGPEQARFGFSMAETVNPWTTVLLDHIGDAAKANGLTVVYHDLDEKTSEAQKADALALLDQDIRVLVLMPRETEIIDDIIQAADARDIPVVLITSDLAYRDACAVCIAIDYELEGRLCARELAANYPEGSRCAIVEILGPEDSAIAAQRDAGFRDELKKYPRLHIVETVRGGFSREVGRTEIEDLVSRLPRGSFQAVFACSDEDALGALYALKLADHKPGEELSIVSINGIQDALKALIAGEFTATIESGKTLGEQIVVVVNRLLVGDTSSRYIAVPYHIYNKETGAWKLDASLY